MLTRRGIFGWLVALGVLGAFLVVVVLNMLGRYTGVTVEQLSPDELLAMLEPHFVVTRPDGEGPFPTALLFSGCDGPSNNIPRWSDALNDAGWATIMVDSHKPRGFEEPQVWALICTGQLLPGAERAGDVAVGLNYVRGLPWVDQERLAVVGASHGGWSIIEALSMWDHDQIPLSLTRWPDNVPGKVGERLKAAFLLYPYCGAFSRVNWQGWDSPLPVKFLLVEEDLIADEEACIDVVEREAERGLPVDMVVFEGVTHAFDHESSIEMSINTFDAEATERALALMVAFLNDAIAEE